MGQDRRGDAGPGALEHAAENEMADGEGQHQGAGRAACQEQLMSCIDGAEQHAQRVKESGLAFRFG